MNEKNIFSSLPVISSSKEIDCFEKINEYIFDFIFLDVKTVKSIFQFLDNAVEDFPIYIFKNNISIYKIKKSSSDSKIDPMVIDLVINENQFLKYYINIKNFSNISDDFHVIQIDPSNINKFLTSVGKDMQLRMYQLKGSNTIEFILNEKNSSSSSFLKINTLEFKHEKCDFKIIDNDMKSQIRFPCNVFGEFCANITKTKKSTTDDTIFYLYKHGLMINTSGGKISKQFGEKCLDVDFLYSFSFSSTIIKLLGSLKNFNKTGVIVIYIINKNVIRLNTSLNIMGEISLYLINDQEE